MKQKKKADLFKTRPELPTLQQIADDISNSSADDLVFALFSNEDDENGRNKKLLDMTNSRKIELFFSSLNKLQNVNDLQKQTTKLEQLCKQISDILNPPRVESVQEIDEGAGSLQKEIAEVFEI